jgi:thiamine transporter
MKDATSSKTRILAEIIVLSSLSAVLYVMRPFSLPYGGSITLGSMVPVMWLSLRRGVYAGLIAGVIFGILALPIDIILLPYSPIANPIQVLLEYPLAFGVLGMAGLFHKKSTIFAMAGVSISVFIKFLLHVLAGYVFWVYVYEFPAEWGLLWPIVYNGSFLIIELVISAILIYALMKRGTLDYAL